MDRLQNRSVNLLTCIGKNSILVVDADNDGYTSGASAVVCYGPSFPSNYAMSNIGIDCNDAVAAINPGMSEVLYNGVDDNCDGKLDEGNQLKTKVLASQCGTTLQSISSVKDFGKSRAASFARYIFAKIFHAITKLR